MVALQKNGHPEPVYVTLFGERVPAAIIQCGAQNEIILDFLGEP